MRKTSKRDYAAFTLIELLIVVAIIAILAAIAVPNFLEAQTRSKVSRAKADMRSISTAIESYVVDYNREPKVLRAGAVNAGDFSHWWGFVPSAITTPVAYMSSIPVMPFNDASITNAWIAAGGTEGNQPYTMIRNTYIPAFGPAWQPGEGPKNSPRLEPYRDIYVDGVFHDLAQKSGYILYTSGPDGVDGTVLGAPALYDSTNGTKSYGDVHRFGSGTPEGEESLGNL